MRRVKLPQAKNYIQKHKKRSIWYKAVITMAALVVFITTYMLILPAITMESDTVCGKQEHIHTDECYETTLALSCGMSEGEVLEDELLPQDNMTSDAALDVVSNSGNVHVHTEECYTEKKVLVCGIEEHTHTDECYAKNSEEQTEEQSSNLAFDPSDYANLGDYVVDVSVAEKPQVFESVLDSTSALKFAPLGGGLNVNKVSGGSTEYNADTDTFDSTLRIDFTITKDEITSNDNTFIYALPSTVSIDVTKLNLDYQYTNKEGDADKFDYWFRMDEDGNYYIEIKFKEEYIDALDDDTVANGYIDFAIYISSDAVDEYDNINIDFGGDVSLYVPSSSISYPENSTANYDLSSSKASSYDSDTNTLTYNVTVYSQKGTGETIEFQDNLLGFESSDLSVSEYTVSVNKAVMLVSSWGTVDTQIIEEITPAYTVDTDTGKFTMTLPELVEGSDIGSDGKYCNAYVINYTYTLDELPENTSTKIANEVTVKSNIYDDTFITSTSRATTTVEKAKPKLISKSASSDGSNTIWTITVGDENTDLAGYVLTDTMFTDNVNIEPSDGYDISKDDNGNVASITFSSGCASQYKITYSTSSGWNAAYNSAVLSDGDGNEVGTASATGYGAGSVSKSDAVLIEEDGNVKTLEWTVTFEVPAGGIPAGKVEDYLRSTDKGHYMSYSDVQNLIKQLNDTEALKGKISNLQFYLPDWSWCDADNIEEGVKIVAFTYDLAEITQEDAEIFSFTYTTTIDTTDLTEGETYENYISAIGKADTGSYQYNKRVTKKDGNGHTGTTSVKNDDGYATWIIQVNIDDEVSDSITVEDLLPSAVELEKLEISLDNKTYTEISHSSADEYSDLNLITSVASDNTVTTYISAAARSYISSIYLRYTCKIKEDNMPAEGTSETFTLENSAQVTIGTTPYGTAEQTQILTVGEVAEQVDKSYVWNKDNQTVSYAVEINPGSEQFGDGESYEFVDTLTYYDYDDSASGSHRVLNLDISSVKLYYMATDENGKLIKDENGKYVKGDLVSADDWTLTSYSEDVGNSSAVKKIITAQFPDKTPLIFEYTYNVIEFAVVGYDTKLFSKNEVTINSQILGNGSYNYCSTDWSAAGTSAGIDIGYAIYKHSSNKLNEGLDGAVFELYVYDSTQDKYITANKTYTTENGGYAKINFASEGLEYNTLYYLAEIKPPVGYMLPNTLERLYFYVSNADTDTYPTNMPKSLPSDAVDLADSSNKSYTKSIENVVISNTSIKVDKQWYGLDNALSNDAPGAESIKFDLLRYYKPKKYDNTDSTVNVSYNITDGSGTVNKESLSVSVGSEVSLVFTTTGNKWWTPPLLLEKNGEEVVNLSNGDPNWKDYTTYTYSFKATEDTEIIGTITCSTDEYSTEVIVQSDTPVYVSTVDDIEADGDYTLDETVTYTLSGDNNWSVDITDLPVGGMVDDVYVDYIYAVKEITSLEDYNTEYVLSDGNITIQNKKVVKKFIEVVKEWYSADNTLQNKASGDITFELWRHVVEKSPSNKLSIKLGYGSAGNEFFDYEEYHTSGSTVTFKLWYEWKEFADPKIYYNGVLVEETNDNISVDDTGNYYIYTFNLTGDVEITGCINWSSGSEEVKAEGPVVKANGSEDTQASADEKVADFTYTNTVSAPDWKTTIDVAELPATGTLSDGTEVEYTYFIKEVPISGYETSYVNNDGISPNDIDGTYTITIQNTQSEDQSVVLPNTGGTGTTVYTIGGSLMIISAACLLYIRFLKIRGRAI